MPPAEVLLICALAAGIYLGSTRVAGGVKKVASKTKHGIVHVVTLGKK